MWCAGRTGLIHRVLNVRSSVWNRDAWLKVRYLPASACYHLHLTALSGPGGIYKIFTSRSDPPTQSPARRETEAKRLIPSTRAIPARR